MTSQSVKIFTTTGTWALTEPAAEVVTTVYVPLVVTVIDDAVLPLCHRMPVPPAPGVAVRVAGPPQYAPAPLTVGFAGIVPPSDISPEYTHMTYISSV
jgi:hypothetical protein